MSDSIGTAEITKTQQKRLAKRERIRAKYLQKKEETKKPRIAEEPHKWGQRQERNAMMRCDYESNCDRGPTVIIDCGWDDGMMTEKETLSLTQQIMYSYSVNKKAKRPAKLCVYGASEKQIALLRKLPGFDTWYMRLSSDSLSMFDNVVEQGVYLTADTENVLEMQPNLEENILVIGGIVDRNRYKNATVKKAETVGMRVAQLPIGELMKMKSSKVLAVNHVFEILTEFFDHRDWPKAFTKVIPDRKKLADDSSE